LKKEIKLVVADDHPIFRSGLKQAIESSGEYVVVAEADNGEEALLQIQSLTPDVAILDLDMPRLNGFQVVKALLAKNISTKIIFLTMHKAEDLLQEALNLKVKGYVLKENALHEVIKAIDTIYNGESYICAEISGSFLTKNIFSGEQDGKKLLLEKLTQTERTILKLVAHQKTSKEIAADLFISYKTVEKHRSNICDKLNLSGNNALLMFAIDHKDIL